MEVKISFDEERVKAIPTGSVSFVFATKFNQVQLKHLIKPSKKFLGAPWTPKGKGKRKKSDRS